MERLLNQKDKGLNYFLINNMKKKIVKKEKTIKKKKIKEQKETEIQEIVNYYFLVRVGV